jgi:hypothetical protein
MLPALCTQAPLPLHRSVVHTLPSSAHAVLLLALVTVQVDVPLQACVWQVVLVQVTAVPLQLPAVHTSP